MTLPASIFAYTFILTMLGFSCIKRLLLAKKIYKLKKTNALSSVNLYKELFKEKNKYFLDNDLEILENFGNEETKLINDLNKKEKDELIGVNDQSIKNIETRLMYMAKKIEIATNKLELMATAIVNIHDSIKNSIEYQNLVVQALEKDLLILEKKRYGEINDVFSIIIMEAFVKTIHNNTLEKRFIVVKERLTSIEKEIPA